MIVSSGMLHDDPDLAIQCMQLCSQVGKTICGMRNLVRLCHHRSSGTNYSDSTSTVGNIDPYCEYVESSRCVVTMAFSFLPIADSNCSLTRVTTMGSQPAQIERCTMGRLADSIASAMLLRLLARPLPSHYTT